MLFAQLTKYETEHCGARTIAEYTEVLCGRLKMIADRPEFKGLQVFRNCFGTWAETIYRIVKLDSAAFFCARKEHIINNEGRGGNGKSLHQYFLTHMFGR